MSATRTVLERNFQAVRAYGATALNMCHIAAGHFEVYVDEGPHIWDYAAGQVIVEEAGGVVCDPSGGPLQLQNRAVLATNAKLFPLLFPSQQQGSDRG
mmetsp:Transcript_830/g.2413  ORF Transcript_830/g.2413 Transcript_830/m.2413 type:complete len:98 (+) Transcript_830:792-1085(+)